MTDTLPKDQQEFIDLCKAKSYDQLTELQLLVAGDITRIRTQLSEYKLRQQTTGPTGSPEWVYKANTSLSYQRWRLATCRTILQEKREQLTKMLSFYEAAKSLLDPDTFNLIESQVA